VTERSFARMVAKPDWGIDTFTAEDGRDHLVNIETVVERPFGDLIHFHVRAASPTAARCCWWRRCRATTRRSCARPCAQPAARLRGLHHRLAQRPRHSGLAGKFDVEDYTLYLVDFMRELGPDTM
jgi:poly(3-hydroxybutyrate) depolymerase